MPPTTQKLTPDQFANDIKAKYPQYQSVDNATLTQKMLAKYPQYADKVDMTSTTGAPTQQPQSFMQKVGGVLGGAAKGITNALGLGSAVNVFGSDIANATAPQSQKQYLPKPTVAQNIGAVAQTAATAGSFALAPESLAGSAAAFGGVGAATAAGGALASGNTDPASIAKKSFIGGLTGAAVGAIGGAIQKGTQYVLDKAPEGLMNTALNINKKIISAGKSPADFLVDEGVWGSLGSISKQAQAGMTEESGIIDKAVSGLDQVGTPAPTYDEIKETALKTLKNSSLGNLYSDADLGDMIDKVPLNKVKSSPTGVSWKDLNSTRSSLGSLLGDTKWLQTNPTESTKATKAVYGAMADSIKDATGTGDNFARYSKWIETNKAVGKALSTADSKWKLGLLDLLSAGATRAANSPTLLTGAAQAVASVPTVGGALGRAATTDILGNTIGASK